MVRLISPRGVIVSVSEEKAERLGWEPYQADQPADPPKRRPGRPKKSEN